MELVSADLLGGPELRDGGQAGTLPGRDCPGLGEPGELPTPDV